MGRLLLACSLVVLALSMGQNARAAGILNFSGSGTLGPIIGGTDCPGVSCDPLHIDGKNFNFTGTLDEAVNPTPCSAGITANVCYDIPAGNLTGQVGNAPPYTTTTDSTLALTIPGGTANDIMEIDFTVQAGSPVTAILYLAPGSFDSNALLHPEPFVPSPQAIPAATSAPPTINGSSVTYCEINCSIFGSTALGLTATVSSSSTGGTVPEPVTMVLMGAGLVGLALYRRRKP